MVQHTQRLVFGLQHQLVSYLYNIDTIDGCRLSNEACHEHLKKKIRYYCVTLYITNKMEHFSYNNGHAMQVLEHLKKLSYSVTYTKNFGIYIT